MSDLIVIKMSDRSENCFDRSKKTKEKMKKGRHKNIKEEKDHRSKKNHRNSHRKRAREFNSDSESDSREHQRHNRVRGAEPLAVESGRKKIKQENDHRPKDQKKVEPNMALSGKLAEDTNTFNGVVIKYNEPDEARKPKRRWRLYPFKGDKTLPFIPIHRQSAYLLGRSRMIADIPIDHPSCSKQHAVLQFRLVDFEREDGTTGKRVRPYIIDLESANGTYVNNKRVEPRRFTELLEKDVIKFGYSTREYVIIHEESKHHEEEECE